MSASSVEFLNMGPVEAQQSFAQQFDLNRPDQAMSSYQKVMHQHTKQQFENATASSRRRSADSNRQTASLRSEDSSRMSVSSQGE